LVPWWFTVFFGMGSLGALAFARTNPGHLWHYGLSFAMFNLVAALVFVLVWRLNQRSARRLQRQIDELNALEGQR